MLGWFSFIDLGGNWIDHRYLVRYIYDESYHMDLNLVRFEALCDDHADCLGIGQDHTSMLLWTFGHGGYNIKVYTICEKLVTTKDYLMIMWTFQVNSGIWNSRVCDS